MPVPDSFPRRYGGREENSYTTYSPSRSAARSSYLSPSSYTSKHSSATLPPRPAFERKLSSDTTTTSRFLSPATRIGSTYGSSGIRTSASPVRAGSVTSSSLRREVPSFADRIKPFQLDTPVEREFTSRFLNRARGDSSSVGLSKPSYGGYAGRDRSGSRELGQSSLLSSAPMTLTTRAERNVRGNIITRAASIGPSANGRLRNGHSQHGSSPSEVNSKSSLPSSEPSSSNVSRGVTPPTPLKSSSGEERDARPSDSLCVGVNGPYTNGLESNHNPESTAYSIPITITTTSSALSAPKGPSPSSVPHVNGHVGDKGSTKGPSKSIISMNGNEQGSRVEEKGRNKGQNGLAIVEHDSNGNPVDSDSHESIQGVNDSGSHLTCNGDASGEAHPSIKLKKPQSKVILHKIKIENEDTTIKPTPRRSSLRNLNSAGMNSGSEPAPIVVNGESSFCHGNMNGTSEGVSQAESTKGAISEQEPSLAENAGSMSNNRRESGPPHPTHAPSSSGKDTKPTARRDERTQPVLESNRKSTSPAPEPTTTRKKSTSPATDTYRKSTSPAPAVQPTYRKSTSPAPLQDNHHRKSTSPVNERKSPSPARNYRNYTDHQVASTSREARSASPHHQAAGSSVPVPPTLPKSPLLNGHHVKEPEMGGLHGSKYTCSSAGSKSDGGARAGHSSSESSDNDSDIYTASPTLGGRFRSSRDKRSEEKDSGLNGLRNIGNTCFMNSVVQCLSNTKPLLEYLTKKNYSTEINTSNSSMKGALMKAFAQVIHELWRDTRSVVDTSAFKDQIQKFAPRFMGYSQQDAQEFLRYLLEGLHEDVNRVTMKPKPILTEIEDSWSDSQKATESWKRYLRSDDSKVVDLFVGQLKSTLKCTTCGHCSVTFDPFWDLSLPIPSKNSQVRLSQCLELFTKEEILDGEEKPTCAKCATRRKCTKSFSIQKFPRILVIHLKRFSPTERYRGKLSTSIDFPINGLDMTPYAASRSSGCVYNLYGVANHSGSTYSGHYIAYCKHPYNGDWYCYNDSRVSPMSTQSVVSSDGYVLFYELSNSSQY